MDDLWGDGFTAWTAEHVVTEGDLDLNFNPRDLVALFAPIGRAARSLFGFGGPQRLPENATPQTMMLHHGPANLVEQQPRAATIVTTGTLATRSTWNGTMAGLPVFSAVSQLMDQGRFPSSLLFGALNRDIGALMRSCSQPADPSLGFGEGARSARIGNDHFYFSADKFAALQRLVLMQTLDNLAHALGQPTEPRALTAPETSQGSELVLSGAFSVPTTVDLQNLTPGDLFRAFPTPQQMQGLLNILVQMPTERVSQLALPSSAPSVGLDAPMSPRELARLKKAKLRDMYPYAVDYLKERDMSPQDRARFMLNRQKMTELEARLQEEAVAAYLDESFESESESGSNESSTSSSTSTSTRSSSATSLSDFEVVFRDTSEETEQAIERYEDLVGDFTFNARTYARLQRGHYKETYTFLSHQMNQLDDEEFKTFFEAVFLNYIHVQSIQAIEECVVQARAYDSDNNFEGSWMNMATAMYSMADFRASQLKTEETLTGALRKKLKKYPLVMLEYTTKLASCKSAEQFRQVYAQIASMDDDALQLAQMENLRVHRQITLEKLAIVQGQIHALDEEPSEEFVSQEDLAREAHKAFVEEFDGDAIFGKWKIFDEAYAEKCIQAFPRAMQFMLDKLSKIIRKDRDITEQENKEMNLATGELKTKAMLEIELIMLEEALKDASEDLAELQSTGDDMELEYQDIDLTCALDLRERLAPVMKELDLGEAFFQKEDGARYINQMPKVSYRILKDLELIISMNIGMRRMVDAEHYETYYSDKLLAQKRSEIRQNIAYMFDSEGFFDEEHLEDYAAIIRKEEVDSLASELKEREPSAGEAKISFDNGAYFIIPETLEDKIIKVSAAHKDGLMTQEQAELFSNCEAFYELAERLPALMERALDEILSELDIEGQKVAFGRFFAFGEDNELSIVLPEEWLFKSAYDPDGSDEEDDVLSTRPSSPKEVHESKPFALENGTDLLAFKDHLAGNMAKTLLRPLAKPMPKTTLELQEEERRAALDAAYLASNLPGGLEDFELPGVFDDGPEEDELRVAKKRESSLASPLLVDGENVKPTLRSASRSSTRERVGSGVRSEASLKVERPLGTPTRDVEEPATKAHKEEVATTRHSPAPGVAKEAVKTGPQKPDTKGKEVREPKVPAAKVPSKAPNTSGKKKVERGSAKPLDGADRAHSAAKAQNPDLVKGSWHNFKTRFILVQAGDSCVIKICKYVAHFFAVVFFPVTLAARFCFYLYDRCTATDLTKAEKKAKGAKVDNPSARA